MRSWTRWRRLRPLRATLSPGAPPSQPRLLRSPSTSGLPCCSSTRAGVRLPGGGGRARRARRDDRVPPKPGARDAARRVSAESQRSRGMTDSPKRDQELGAALLELEVPEHRVDFERELHGLLALERHRRRRLQRLRWIVVPALAAAAIIVVLLVGLPRTASGPSTASAARVQAKMRAAFAQAHALTGTLVFATAGRRSRAKFALNARGDLRIEIPGTGTA